MNRLGAGATVAGAMLGVGGWLVDWPAPTVLGLGLLALCAFTAIWVAYQPRVSLERQVEPARVEKGSAAIARVQATNLSRRSLPALGVEQRVGDVPVLMALPRLRRGESTVRSYRLPTSVRGEFELGPVELVRVDPFGLWRRVRRLGTSQRIAVHPRILPLPPLHSGRSLNLEGPTSDASPQGSITFHRLREYVAGDDLRTIHWPSTARTGSLMVRHNVDTAQPYTVVLLDLSPPVYTLGTFEEAVDVAASVLSAAAVAMSPVQLRTTAGNRLGGLRQRDPWSAIDHLTAVTPVAQGSLRRELLLLRGDRGGSALVVVTGRLDPEGLPAVGVLRAKFDRLMVLSVVPELSTTPTFPGVVVLAATNADDLSRSWHRQALK
ncbi:MAG: DUF58 domain-containing protein [Acidimicrobiales bacterium]